MSLPTGPDDIDSSHGVRGELMRRAEMICRGASLCDAPREPPDVSLLELLADLAGRRGQEDFARACTRAGGTASDAAFAGAAAPTPADDDVERLLQRGRDLLREGAIAEAVEVFRDAVTRERSNVSACAALAEALDLLGEPHRLEAASAWCCLGAAFAARDRFGDAAAAYEAAQARHPASLNAMVRLGLADLELARPREAVARFETVVAIKPRHSVAHTGLGWASHLVGDAARGWKELALDRRKIGEREFDAPAWDGVAPLEGRTLLVWADQALGDTIQFSRDLALVKRAGARVLFECGAVLLPLLERLPAVDVAVARGTPMPAYDLHVPLSGLRGLDAEQASRGPNGAPYLSVDEEDKARWRARLRASGGGSDTGDAARLTVGLVWSGEPTRVNGRAKFAPLSAFAPLAAVPSTRIVSLQMGPQLCELLAPPPGLTIETLLTPSSSIVDTASLILNLDLVVTVDTMVAHLAGALGHPVWTLLPFAPDWRWRSEGASTPWYHSMRLFRQTQPQDWTNLLRQVASQLSDLSRWLICSVHPAFLGAPDT